MLKAAIIGFGGIAQAHKNGYIQLEKEGKVKLVAACDVRREAFEKVAEINLKSDTSQKADFHCYTDLEEMLAKEEIDFVDICVPSYLHKEMAVRMLNRGCNVLCEKPMALNSRDCAEMLKAEKASGKHFMIAQCLRFFPEYEFLKECIDDKRFGKVLGAFFNRSSAQPLWGFENWYLDYHRSGGAITDIHIHDIDMGRFLFGEPDAVSCRATDCKTRYDIVQTALYYGNTPITANGCWTAGKIPFSAFCRVDFERASVEYAGGKVTVYPEEGESFNPSLPAGDGYQREIAYFCDVVAGKIQNKKNPASSAAKTIRLIETMKSSADRGGQLLKC